MGGVGREQTTATAKCRSFDYGTHGDAVSAFAQDDNLGGGRKDKVLPVVRPKSGEGLEEFDHYVGGFDQGCCGVSAFELHLADGVGGDDGGDALVADGEYDLGHQAVDLEVYDFAYELIAAADLAVALSGAEGGGFDFALEEGLERRGGDAM